MSSLLDEVLEARDKGYNRAVEEDMVILTSILKDPETRNVLTIFPEVGDYFKSAGFKVEGSERGYLIYPERG